MTNKNEYTEQKRGKHYHKKLYKRRIENDVER